MKIRIRVQKRVIAKAIEDGFEKILNDSAKDRITETKPAN